MKSYKVTYNDWDGNPVNETYYFYINETELAVLNGKYDGSLARTLARLTQDNSPREAMEILMDILKTAYGVMDDDRKHFRKASSDPKIWEDFISTEGFNKFFMDVMGDDAKCAEFIKGIMPKALQDAMDADTNNGKEPSKKLAMLTAADVTIT